MGTATDDANRPEETEENPYEVMAVTTVPDSDQRCRVLFRNGEAMELSLDAAVKYTLKKGTILSSEEFRHLGEDEAVFAAVQRAISYLRYRPRTRQELLRYLRKLGCSADISQRAASECEARGYIDDIVYAKLWIEDRMRQRPCGQRLIIAELSKRGIARQITSQVLAGLRFDEWEAANRTLRRRLPEGESPETIKEWQRTAAWMARRGFPSSIIRELLGELPEDGRS